jgi:hypothetical protein
MITITIIPGLILAGSKLMSKSLRRCSSSGAKYSLKCMTEVILEIKTPTFFPLPGIVLYYIYKKDVGVLHSEKARVTVTSSTMLLLWLLLEILMCLPWDSSKLPGSAASDL